MEFFKTFLSKYNPPLITADNCAIIPGTKALTYRVPSAYLAHVVFFFSFLFTNAYYIYVLPKENSSSDEQYENRRNRTFMIMIILILIFIIISIVRYRVTGCEVGVGILITVIFFAPLGVGAYKLAEYCGMRTSDVLGITSSFVPNAAEKPVACGRT